VAIQVSTYLLLDALEIERHDRRHFVYNKRRVMLIFSDRVVNQTQELELCELLERNQVTLISTTNLD
jgi:hypothetical protein